ncbi:hypothetical protein ES703_43128 [subsurface metagenome]
MVDIKFASKTRSPSEEYTFLIYFPISLGPPMIILYPPRSHKSVFINRSAYNKFVEANLCSVGKTCVLKTEIESLPRSKLIIRGIFSPEERTTLRKA